MSETVRPAESASPVIALMVAVAENGVIGQGGTLPWRIPSDLKTFRRITMGKPLIMGRKTFASLKSSLDGRDNIVVTRDPRFAAPGALAAHSLPEAVAIARDCAAARSAGEIMVIGGADIFREALPLCHRLYLTRVHGTPEGDVLFPDTNLSGWRETAREPRTQGPKDEYAFTLSVLDRI